MGTKECDERDVVDVTFQVMAGDSDFFRIIDDITTIIDDCDLFGTTIVQREGREIDGEINGNQISFLEKIKSNNEDDIRCVWKGTRQ